MSDNREEHCGRIGGPVYMRDGGTCPECGARDTHESKQSLRAEVERLKKVEDLISSLYAREGAALFGAEARIAATLKLLEKGLDCGTGELCIEGHDGWDREQFLEALKGTLTGENKE